MRSAESRKASRYIPKNSIEVSNELGAAYVYRAGSRYVVIAYRGTASKSAFHYGYANMEAVDLAICNFFDSLKTHKERVRNYRRESYKPHTFKTNDIVTNSWGYDQTNVDWYRVVRTTASYVWLQPIACNVEETDFMSGSSKPAVNTDGDPKTWGFVDKKEPVQMHRASGESVSMKYGCGSKWSGETKYCSWYA
jgi:hypothetical protein